MKTIELRFFERGAIASPWEVKSAKLQTNIGDHNAGLAEDRYEMHSKLHNEYEGWVAISFLKSMPVAANESDWRDVA